MQKCSNAFTIPRLPCYTQHSLGIATLFSTRNKQFEFWEYLDCDMRNKAHPIPPDRILEIAKVLNKSDVTDIIVISHGWRTNFDQAAESYKILTSNIVSTMEEDGQSLEGVKLGLIGIRWPS